MTAPAKKRRQPPLRVVEAHRLVVSWHEPHHLWTWRLWDDDNLIVATGPSMVSIEELWRRLCSVFDLVATPESYVRRFERKALTEVQSAGGRWFSVEWGAAP